MGPDLSCDGCQGSTAQQDAADAGSASGQTGGLDPESPGDSWHIPAWRPDAKVVPAHETLCRVW
jgi:hypothetical protein